MVLQSCPLRPECCVLRQLPACHLRQLGVQRLAQLRQAALGGTVCSKAGGGATVCRSGSSRGATHASALTLERLCRQQQSQLVHAALRLDRMLLQPSMPALLHQNALTSGGSGLHTLASNTIQQFQTMALLPAPSTSLGRHRIKCSVASPAAPALNNRLTCPCAVHVEHMAWPVLVLHHAHRLGQEAQC